MDRQAAPSDTKAPTARKRRGIGLAARVLWLIVVFVIIAEIAIFVPLVLLTIWYGIAPGTILDAFAAPTEALIKNYQAAITAAKTAMLAVQ